MNQILERRVTPREPPLARPPLPTLDASRLTGRDALARPIAAANDSIRTAPADALRTGLDRDSARWLPLAVPGFALVVLLVCGALVWTMAL
ncbi:MAG: hypothetical protein LKCHEGNO_00920 [Burkholderiaceae bacterium]|nr:hypothetical protein [Burkholderiaceae bacterium]